MSDNPSTNLHTANCLFSNEYQSDNTLINHHSHVQRNEKVITMKAQAASNIGQAEQARSNNQLNQPQRVQQPVLHPMALVQHVPNFRLYVENSEQLVLPSDQKYVVVTKKGLVFSCQFRLMVNIGQGGLGGGGWCKILNITQNSFQT